MNRKIKKISSGFSLIEVMVAVLVFSFGLLAIAGLLGVAVKSNYNGFLRSQAMFHASSILDSMRRNTPGVWNGSYDGTVSGYKDFSNLCKSGSACNFDALAERDLALWSTLLDQSLPNSTGTIECPQDAAMVATTVNVNQPFLAIEPFSGVCEITITWTESNETSGSDTQTLIYQGKP